MTIKAMKMPDGEVLAARVLFVNDGANRVFVDEAGETQKGEVRCDGRDWHPGSWAIWLRKRHRGHRKRGEGLARARVLAKRVADHEDMIDRMTGRVRYPSTCLWKVPPGHALLKTMDSWFGIVFVVSLDLLVDIREDAVRILPRRQHRGSPMEGGKIPRTR